MSREFLYPEAQAMTPLVRQILTELTLLRDKERDIASRLDLLRECRLSSNYNVRRRYYEAETDMGTVTRRMDDAVAELDDLGVELIDLDQGIAGFRFTWAPRAGSNRFRDATFLLKLKDRPEAGIKRWRFVDDNKEHRVPKHWAEVESRTRAAHQ